MLIGDDVCLFSDNVAARRLPWSVAQLRDVWEESVSRYAELPLFCSGNSKELRCTSVPGLLIGRFLPTLYSYTQNRTGIVPGTDSLRMKISGIFWRHLHGIGVRTCYLACSGDFILVSQELIPPVEVIVKRALIGTPAHIYDRLFEQRDRFDKPFVKGERHPAYVRFDYRNPLTSAAGDRLRDEMLPLPLADRLIDTENATGLALKVSTAVEELLNAVGLQMLDICLFVDRSGTVLCGEISPDNMRIKSLESDADFDKDLWRKGRPAGELTAQWANLHSRLDAAHAPR
jgi:phosphoribosylaminoimidazole-succinocarboxamide synthase